MILGKLLNNNILDSALLDQLLHHAHVVNRGQTYRMRERWKTDIQPVPPAELPADRIPAFGSFSDRCFRFLPSGVDMCTLIKEMQLSGTDSCVQEVMWICGISAEEIRTMEADLPQNPACNHP